MLNTTASPATGEKLRTASTVQVASPPLPACTIVIISPTAYPSPPTAIAANVTAPLGAVTKVIEPLIPAPSTIVNTSPTA